MNNNTNQMSQSFGKWLLDARKAKGFTQEYLAKKAGVSKPYIGHLENVRPHTISGALPKPDREKVIAIAQALNEDINEALHLAGYASQERQFPPKMTQMLKNLSFHLEDKNLSQEEKDALFDEVEFAYYLALDRLEKRKKEKKEMQ